jgi:hypothetical protein
MSDDAKQYRIEAILEMEPVDQLIWAVEQQVTDATGHEASASAVPGGVAVSIWVEAWGAGDTLDGVEHLLKALGTWGNGVNEIRIQTIEQVERDLARPTIPVLVGASEAAGILDVSRQRVHQLHRDRSDFPTPLVEVAMGPLWDAEAIKAYATTRNRQGGRPRGVWERYELDAYAETHQEHPLNR